MTAQAGGMPTMLTAGFADPTRDAQRAFRAVLDALAHPATSYPLAGPAQPPAVLGHGLGAVALTVLDEECTAWFGGRLADDAVLDAWLAFHTGVRRVADEAAADFVFVDPAAMPSLAALTLGTDEAPHCSATVVFDVRGCTGTARFNAEGPGIDGSAVLDAPWADDAFLTQWRRNGGLFPRGVDLLLVDVDSVSALPRTTRLTVADPEQEA